MIHTATYNVTSADRSKSKTLRSDTISKNTAGNVAKEFSNKPSTATTKNQIIVKEYGAQVVSWRTQNGEDQLFLSSKESIQSDKSLRGGVPVIFPQFGEFGTIKRHGFARNMRWQKLNPLDRIANKENKITLRLSETQETLALWPHHFIATFEAEVFANKLCIRLNIENTSEPNSANTDFSFAAALHSYFRIQQLNDITIEGLQGREYWNNGEPLSTRHRQQDKALSIDAAIDRVYYRAANSADVTASTNGSEIDNTNGSDKRHQSPTQKIILIEPNQHRNILSKGFCDTVIWNPGPKGAAELSDMEDDEYQRMICIESAAIEQPITLAPQQQWTGEQTIELAPS